MTPQELKNSILQLAVQGKLVEQRPEEGTADALYRHIQAEKQKLIKAGKIKKDKPLPEIAEDEKPFDIPESWKWVRIGALTYNWGQKTPDNRFCYVDVGSVNNTSHTLNSENTVVEAKDASSRAKKIVKYGDVIFATIRPYLKNICIIDRDFPYEPIVSTAFAVMHCPEGVLNKYLYHYLLSPTFMSFANASDKAKGVAYPAIGEKDFFNGIIALPPVAEQKRIVAKIEELLPYIDRYAASYERLEQVNTEFPEDMKKSVLQYAIQGKLVEQRPEEGTAEELYRQIQTEKKRLIKEGKIKKEKPLPEIAEDEIPFDIPESWKWVRLSNIAESIVDCPHSTPKYLDMETEYCTIDTNCIDEKGDITKWRYVDADTYTARIARLTPQKDDIVYTREGSICRAAILPEDPKVCLGQRVMLIRSANGVFPQFIRRLLMSPMVIRKLTEQQKGIGAKHVNVSDVCNLILPLPPLAEQERIVAKLEEILPLCEKLK